MSYILALDQGTTSCRALIFDREGTVRSVAQREFAQIFPRPGLVEHDGREIWATQAGVAAEALTRAGITPRQVAAIGITNQRETTLLWDRRTGEPLHNAIVWQDRRTAPHCDRLKADGLEPLFRRKTGLVLDAYFSGTKLAWLLENVPGARARAANGELAFGTVDSWLAWNLSGGRLHITDASNASRTLLFDINRQEWDDGTSGDTRHPRATAAARWWIRARSTARRPETSWLLPFPLPAWPATSRRPCSARRAAAPAWQKTPMAPVVSC